MDSHAQSLGAIIPQILKTWKLDERLREDDVAAAWEGIVGAFNARHTAPDGLKRGVLTVRVLQPALHHTLMMQKGSLLKRLQERFGEKEIKDLRQPHRFHRAIGEMVEAKQGKTVPFWMLDEDTPANIPPDPVLND